MIYMGRVHNGVVVIDGPNRPPDGTPVRIEVMDTNGPSWGEVLKDLIGTAEGLPVDLADDHDHYIHGKPRSGGDR